MPPQGYKEPFSAIWTPLWKMPRWLRIALLVLLVLVFLLTPVFIVWHDGSWYGWQYAPHRGGK